MTDSKSKNPSISVRQIAKLLKKFHLNDNDIIVLNSKSSMVDNNVIDSLRNALESLKVNVVIVVAEDFDDLTILNETEMNKRGWFRLSKLNKFIRT